VFIGCFLFYLSANGYMEIDLDSTSISTIFGQKPTTLKVDNAPLRSCYQRPSDSPLIFNDGTAGYTVSSSRRRRSIEDEDTEDILSVVEYRKKLERTKRQTVTYDYSALCDRIIDGSTSSLST